MSALSDIIANTPAGGTAALPAGEYEGPVVINKPLTLRGSSATVWSKHGSVIEVSSQGVTLEGLRVEITEGAFSEPAITAKFPVNIRDVEVLGTVSGFGAEDGECGIPRALQLGELSPSEENGFIMTVDIPAPAKLVCTAASGCSSAEAAPLRWFIRRFFWFRSSAGGYTSAEGSRRMLRR